MLKLSAEITVRSFVKTFIDSMKKARRKSGFFLLNFFAVKQQLGLLLLRICRLHQLFRRFWL